MFLNASNFIMTFIGDSIIQGCRIENIEDSYVSIIRRRLFNELLGQDEFETLSNFTNLNTSFDFNIYGNYVYGNHGPLKTSLILNCNCKISVRGKIGLVGIYYRSLDPSIVVKVIQCNKVLKVISLNPSSNGSFSVLLSSSQCTNTEYEFDFIGSNVEIMGFLVLRSSTPKIIFNRFAVSGYSSTDFVDDQNLSSIYSIGTLFNNPGVFLLGVGTNDIYSLKKSVYSEVYEENLSKIIRYLSLNELNRIILIVPPQANETKYRILKSPYEKYRECIYKLSKTLKTELIDYSTVDFVANDLYVDGIHPNEKGHLFIANFICDQLGIKYK